MRREQLLKQHPRETNTRSQPMITAGADPRQTSGRSSRATAVRLPSIYFFPFPPSPPFLCLSLRSCYFITTQCVHDGVHAGDWSVPVSRLVAPGREKRKEVEAIYAIKASGEHRAVTQVSE